MKYLLLSLAISTPALAEPVFTVVTYYEGLGEQFRVETASAWPKCQESKRARKIFLHKPNELREVAYWDKNDKIHEAGKSNNPEVHKIVNEIFAGSRLSGNPCLEGVPEINSSKASGQ